MTDEAYGDRARDDGTRGVALGRPETVRALARDRKRAYASAVAGAAVWALGAWLRYGTAYGPGSDLPIPLILLGGIATLRGLGGLVMARRMRRALAAGPWNAYPAVLLMSGVRNVVVVLGDPATGETLPLYVKTQRPRLAKPDADGVMWWCGDPVRGGVLARSSGDRPIWTTPVRRPAVRQFMVQEAAERGLLDGPEGVEGAEGAEERAVAESG
ncbi:hypothetical protein [Streptomyces laurentii]|uniref:hypothetical protein n=1 Tax=Streptomyces laurentii TaxID=39478 RepID=UPI0036BF70BF